MHTRVLLLLIVFRVFLVFRIGFELLIRMAQAHLLQGLEALLLQRNESRCRFDCWLVLLILLILILLLCCFCGSILRLFNS